jgi:hypothetical protein
MVIRRPAPGHGRRDRGSPRRPAPAPSRTLRRSPRRVLLAGPDLQRQSPPGASSGAGAGGDGAVGIKSVRPAVERLAADRDRALPARGGQAHAGDVGRIGDDQVEAALQALVHQSAATKRPARRPRGARHWRAPRRVPRRDIGPGAAGAGQFGQQRHQDGARPGAEIEDVERRGSRCGKAEGALDQRLGVGARVEAGRSDGEDAAVELALGEDPRQWLARQPAPASFPAGEPHRRSSSRSGAAISASWDSPVAAISSRRASSAGLAIPAAASRRPRLHQRAQTWPGRSGIMPPPRMPPPRVAGHEFGLVLGDQRIDDFVEAVPSMT